ncbi:response regulator transcription factor [Thiomicrorhabdus cannonii]|uniref:response regulator transcription factor n=1 Tax=Thiomicrorhabdus cannonii TaxID=2748011 RepID=UPI001C4A9105|nr:response regulator transcription factor [Thiomicrorhabdus cannonii]
MKMSRWLLVDDDATFLQVLRQALQYRQVACDLAETPQQALQLVQSQAYARIVVDLNIDGESGLNLLKAILESRPESKVLILTGYASVATAVEAIHIGAVNYLCKPASVDEIIQAFEWPEPEEGSTASENKQTEEDEEFQPMSVKRLEWEHIQKVLMEHGGNISATAQALNMHRRTLQRKLQKRPVEK